MGIFYKRTETQKEVVIIYKYTALFYPLVIALIVLGGVVNVIFMFLAALIILVYMIDLFKPSNEIKKAMRERSVTLSGSKYSLKNPVKAKILKS